MAAPVLKETAAKAFKITQWRSCIGLPEKHRRVLRCIGLRHVKHTVLRTATPSMAGMLYKCKEVLKVELVPRTKTPQEIEQERREEVQKLKAKGIKIPPPPYRISNGFTKIVKPAGLL